MRKKTIGFNVSFDNEDGSFNNARYYAVTYEDNKKKEDDAQITYEIFDCVGTFLGRIHHFRKMELRETVDLLRNSAHSLDLLHGMGID